MDGWRQLELVKTSGMGRRVDLAPGMYLWTPAWQECLCGARDADFNGSFTRRYFLCCSLTYLDDEIVAVGRVWLTRAMRPTSPPSRDRIQEILADCTPPPPGMTTAVYRRFDHAGVLLYIGISDDLLARSRWHERHSPWAQFVASRTTEWFASRNDAQAAETAAIKTELPLFNKQHALPGRIEAAARYLQQDRRVLLVTTEERQT